MTKFRKGQLVEYSLPYSRDTVEAIVRRNHRDGTVTVEARFRRRDGVQQPGYLGYKYRYNPNILRPL